MEAHDERCLALVRTLWRAPSPPWPVIDIESANTDALAHQLALRGIEDKVSALVADLRQCASTRDVWEAIHDSLRTELFVPPDVHTLDDTELEQTLKSALLLLSGEEKLSLVLLIEPKHTAQIDDVIAVMPPLEETRGRASLVVLKDIKRNPGSSRVG